VLLPVLDNDKHYFIGSDEVEKLLRRGKGWLEMHPERSLIMYRYLQRKRTLVREALARLLAEDKEGQAEGDAEDEAQEEQVEEKPLTLHEQRLEAAMDVLRETGATSVLDLGCGEGRLLKLLLQEKQFTRIVGLDVSYRSLELAQRRLRLDRLPEMQKKRISLLQGSLTYRDQRLAGFDAAAVVEVIEHLDPPRLAAFARVLFEAARPRTVVLTTPNAEYNVKFKTMPVGQMRHVDHRFEWTRQEFQDWANSVAERHGYNVRFVILGPEDEVVGAPSQMGVFSLK
jgi:3' terminal RNA ribose 2'-O-methyltransferase Hen1